MEPNTPPAGGGVDMAELHLPVEHLLSETRLRHNLRYGEMFRCEKCNFTSNESRVIARHLVDHGFHREDLAEKVLEIDDYYRNSRECMSDPQEEV